MYAIRYHPLWRQVATWMTSSSTNFGPLFLLGIPYSSASDPAFLADFVSRLWFSYRFNFPQIHPTSYSSDVGWGCMLRSGQMLLANSLAILILGRDWRLSEDSEAKSNAAYIKIMSWFLDSNSSPYSIHRISLQGNQYDKKVGEWFGPNTISFVLKSLITSHPASNLNCHVCPDGVLYKDQMQTALSTNSHTSLTTISPSTTNSPVLILIPLRLGIETLNPVYVPALLKCFEIRQCVGVAGGKPNSSLFFVGAEMSTGNLFYLDPHYNRPAVEIKDLSSYKLQDFSTYHCQIIRTVSIHRIDPSLVLGFLIKDLQDFEEFCKIVEPITSGKTPLFTIGDTEPDYSQNDLLVLSDDEDDFM